jgi:hypothetical protein
MNEFRDVKCPKCGADLEVPANLTEVSCINCGNKFAMSAPEPPPPPQVQETKTPCPDCSGWGYFHCRACNGSGRCFAYALNVTEGVTKYCLNGWCPRCNGRGVTIEILLRETCAHCGGSRVCPTCRGSGKCYACGGYGRITCGRCSGSGKLG